MNRLQLQVHRLYVPPAPEVPAADPAAPGLVDARGRVRAMVLELARPADWAALSRVWQGVQADLALPAPAIAVSGQDGYQLWFSLSEPLPAPQATVFLDSLRLRYLSDIEAHRIALLPAPDASSPLQLLHARLVPAAQPSGRHWSAFVAPDLAPLFADEPWLDVPPNPDGQAGLLQRLDSIQPADLQRALERLRPAAMSVVAEPAATAVSASGPTPPCPAPASARLDAKRFLLDVMNDDSVALGLRIEAAKALLRYADAPLRP